MFNLKNFLINPTSKLHTCYLLRAGFPVKLLTFQSPAPPPELQPHNHIHIFVIERGHLNWERGKNKRFRAGYLVSLNSGLANYVCMGGCGVGVGLGACMYQPPGYMLYEIISIPLLIVLSYKFLQVGVYSLSTIAIWKAPLLCCCYQLMIINGIRITISMNTLSNILSMKRKLEAKEARLICCHWETHISVESGKGSIQNVLVSVTSQTVIIKLQIAIAL